MEQGAQAQIECPNNSDKLSSGMEEYPQSMELKVVMQKDITTYLHRSLPLCMVLAYEKYLSWYYSNFIQIFYHIIIYNYTLDVCGKHDSWNTLSQSRYIIIYNNN